MDIASIPDTDLGLAIDLHLSMTFGLGDPDSRIVQYWAATGEFVDMDTDDRDTILRARFARCQLGHADLWSILDDEEADLGVVASAVIDARTGELRQPIKDLVEGFGSSLLIANSANIVDARFAGRGLGRWLVAEAINILAEDCAVVAGFASPMDSSKENERLAHQAKLRDLWSSIGFEHFEDSILVLDPAQLDLTKHLSALRERFGVAFSKFETPAAPA